MTISVWRYSHLALAVSSFVLLTLASVTGIILAFQPVTEKVQPYRTANLDTVTLAQVLPVLRKTYPEISELSVDVNQFVQIKGSDANGEKLLAYVDPLTGKILGTPKPADEFFQWVTALHRSLFIHETGRFFIGLTAFLLLLIVISGTMLIIQRQRGIKRFFTKIARDNFAQYYHVVLGRLSLIPIFIIALSGTYLSLARFNLIDSTKASTKVDFDAIRTGPAKNAADFAVFKQTKLSAVESIEFPFSEDVEDYYTITLKTGELAINQVTGNVLSEVKYPKAVMFTNLSLDLHTGRANMVWAIILAVASANILFFIYSGFSITWKRLSNRTKNKFKAEESKYIILVGSENGNTFAFAQAIYQQLLKKGEKSHITQLNDYKLFPKAEHLIVMTATYGLGDPPTNAAKFKSLLQKYPQQQQVKYSVVGFGSHAYPDFCKYAFEVEQLLLEQPWAQALTDIHTVNDRSPEEFTLWAEAWAQQADVQLTSLQLQTNNTRLESLTVVDTTSATRADGTFTINLKARRGLKIRSGDLLAIYPENDHRERLYSIGMVNGNIRLSVRLQPNGIGSGFLHRLKAGEKIRAKVVNNQHFHFPATAGNVVMIANGTGIAPFVGMVDQNKAKVPCYLYCGFREQVSYAAHQELLEDAKANGRLHGLEIAFSREGEKQYVSDLVQRDGAMIAEILEHVGVIMICGSLAMQKDVLELLDAICHEKNGKGISHYRSHGQILTDCY
ncbi:PepSY domain-containing protein [Mucilaginibacter auburnensis]|uniref:Sulfite reductase (NADPH) flavoprotein alpha-component n=1 Tax=Mucilaginibacter auburnensis TaxID=1457233 RepID=A0A2H9VRT4_9SPHI|nr:PepSY domain-containing protein [Mucilaginibacter auburnensis]PJJ83530.1 sulfite reductase (NADPH) flavoprotein alpha-component [Mucilaginibacter auburnensis]